MNLSADDFNKIRRDSDYPKLYELFMRKLPHFE